MSMRISRKEGETWRDCVIRYAEPYGLESECLQAFAVAVLAGVSEDRAAWEAAYEWDVLDFIDDKEGET